MFRKYTTQQVRTITLMPAEKVSYQVVDANVRRVGLIFYNNSGNTAYVTYGTSSNASSPTFIVPSYQSVYFLSDSAVWTGPISAIRNAGSNANFSMVVTELVY